MPDMDRNKIYMNISSACFLQILKGAPTVDGRPGATMPDMDLVALKEDLIQKHEYITDKDVLSAALYPKVFDDYREFRKVYGPVDKLDTRVFLHGPDIAEEIKVRDLRLVYLGFKIGLSGI